MTTEYQKTAKAAAEIREKETINALNKLKKVVQEANNQYKKMIHFGFAVKQEKTAVDLKETYDSISNIHYL